LADLRGYKGRSDSTNKELTVRICAATGLLALALAIVPPAFMAAQAAQPSEDKPMQMQDSATAVHDFDFLIGRWRLHHRRLKERLVGNRDWVEFEGTSVAQKLMDGYGNVDDNVLELPGGAYRAVSLRSFDPKTQQWSIWWLDGRTPLGPLDPPVRGGFKDGVGTFYADDTFNGKPIRVRYLWSHITPTSCHWEQAFSSDRGASWETNWMTDLERAP
jgi:hypothetical protein